MIYQCGKSGQIYLKYFSYTHAKYFWYRYIKHIAENKPRNKQNSKSPNINAMYAIQSSRAVLSAPDTHEDFFWDAQLVSEIEALDPKLTYSKTRLGQLWGFNRNTLRRWVEVAIEANTPGFNRAFDQVVKLADCPHCESEIRLNDIQYLHLKRNWLIECPQCGAGFKADPRIKEVSNLDLKLPGRYAQVLRIVGWLIGTYGIETTKKILSDSLLERDKIIRQAIRKLLITGV